ncbi:MAG TPA: polymer-forming cytoskeletal protein [Hyphomicrobiaceae bacterium]|nr:polymer-forming cytoskeletal protein [Hyphomicrobiaceae bacterium]
MLFSRSGATPAPFANGAATRARPHDATAPHAPAIAASACSVIGAGLCVVGDLESTGEVLINGCLNGNVSCRRLTIGRDAVIDGNVTAEEVIVHGKLAGTIRAGGVHLAATASVVGELYHRRLGVEAGAVFEGASHNRARPMKDAGNRERAAALEANADAPPAKPSDQAAARSCHRASLRPDLAARLKRAQRKGNGRLPPPALPQPDAEAAVLPREPAAPTSRLIA